MSWRVLFAWCSLAVLVSPARALAQFTDAHNYDNTPVGVNQLETDYGFIHGNAAIDPALIVAGARLNVNEVTIGYTRYFAMFRRLTWVEAALPIARLDGSVDGTSLHGSTTGAGDSTYSFGLLVKGGPALSVAQFETYQPTTTIGVSVAVTAPTGQYDPEKVLNLGSDRWSFKPEIGVSHPFGPDQKWQVDAYLNAAFYTDNTRYRGQEILRQEALTGLEGHLSYSLNDSLWISADSRYSFRGATAIGGVDQDNAQHNLILGSEVGLSINAHHSLLLEFAKASVHHNSPDVVGAVVKYNYTWGQ